MLTSRKSFFYEITIEVKNNFLKKTRKYYATQNSSEKEKLSRHKQNNAEEKRNQTHTSLSDLNSFQVCNRATCPVVGEFLAFWRSIGKVSFSYSAMFSQDTFLSKLFFRKKGKRLLLWHANHYTGVCKRHASPS